MTQSTSDQSNKSQLAMVKWFEAVCLKHMPPELRHIVDLGSENGKKAVCFAEALQAQQLTMVDNKLWRKAPMPPWASYETGDFLSEEFWQQHRDRHSIVMANMVVHEIDHELFVKRCMKTMMTGAAAFILDYSEEGWAQIKETISQESAFAQTHYREDQKKLRKSGFHRNVKLRYWWEKRAASLLPGQLIFAVEGPVYVVFYLNTSKK